MNTNIYKKAICFSVFVFFGIFFLNSYAKAQTGANKVVLVPNQTTAAENFDLNITQKHITETDFARATNVEFSNSNRGELRVEVGVGVRAETIDVILRGIYGRVRFRASLETLRQKIRKLQKLPASGQNPGLLQP